MNVSPLLPAFGLTLAMSFLVGLALREYYVAQQHLDYFGSVRTYTFIGMLGRFDQLRRLRAVRSVLMGVNAAVVGLLLAAFHSPVWTSAILRPADFGLGLAAFALLVF